VKPAAILVVCLIASVVYAQTTVQSLSSFAKQGSPLPDVCRQEQAVFVNTFAEFPHPSIWTYVIACDDNQWENVLLHIGVQPSMLTYAATIRGRQVTYFRGSTFLHPDLPGSESRHVIAHELAHIYLNSADDAKVDALAHQWMKSRSRGRS
jgi:hypothetical protein